MAADLGAGREGRHGACPATGGRGGAGLLCAAGEADAAAARGDPLAPAAPGGDPLAPAAPGERWTLLYTRSNCERRLGRACARFGIRHYLPLRAGGRRGARARAAVPLFPSYVFACLTERTRIQALETNVVAHVIRVDRPDVMLAELRQIRRALATGADLLAGPRLGRGGRVRVVRGPLAGVEGIVMARRGRGRWRLVLNVSILGRSVATEVDLLDVARASGGWT